jgi:XTP/dITP diphosphohydrolase
MSQQIVLATGNQGKVNELAAMLAPLSLQVLPQSDFNVVEVAETGTTFVENAIIKARHAAKITGLPAIADDSGLCVDILGGAPGVYSSRYAGEGASDLDNITKLLDALKQTPEHELGARFLCVLVFMRHAEDPTPIICQGQWRGQICRVMRGENGFGYDPVFWVSSQNCTSAQLGSEMKNRLSHRGKAMNLLAQQLERTFI